MSRARTLAAVLAAAALGLAGCGGGSGGAKDAGQGAGTTKQTTRVEVVEGLGKGGGFDARSIYKNEAPGVVTVVSLFGGSSLDQVLGGSDGGGGGGGGIGSGFVLNGDGEIATNAHVVSQGTGNQIRRAREVFVEFADGNRVSARVLGADPNADVALLKVDPSGLTLHPLPLGDSGKVQVGEPVAAIGSPFGEEQSLSVGVVSAIDRAIDSLTDFKIPGAVQTDAAINPGNSGGPLVDQDGKVIGINQQIKTNSGGGEGVGFAVPVDVVRRSLGQLRETGTARYAYLGVATVPLYPQLVERFGLKTTRGAWVQDVTPGGPADKAGMRGGSGQAEFQASSFKEGGDVITRIEGTPITNADDLSSVVARFRPGETVTVEVQRGDAKKQLHVKLGDRPLGTPSTQGG